MEANKTKEKKLIREAELLKRVPISKRFLQDLRSNGIIPYIKISRKCVLYDPQEVMEALSKYKVGGTARG